jgi:glycosyltransferase involved in cell wall biosynthesis
MEKPSIIVFIDWYFPGFKAGGPVRSCLNMVEHLKKEFDFYIVTRNTEYTESIPYVNLNFNQWVIGPNEEKVIYLDEAHQNENFYISLLEERNYQSVMIMGLFSKLFSILPLKVANKLNHPNIIVSPRGMLAPGALKIKLFKKKLFLNWANLTGMYRSVNFHVTNENEAQQVKMKIRKFHSLLTADNFPRKVDQNLFSVSTKVKGKLKLVSVARIAPEKNTLFAIEILSKCKSDIELDIYGSVYDTSYWEECKALILKLPSNIKVNYKGDLPSDKLFDILPHYDFLFLPTRGENFGHIILESFMCGLPVIISDKTPWRKLNLQKCGFDISLEDLMDFVKTLDTVSQWNSEQISEWKNASFQLAKSKTDVSELKNKYISML